MRLKAWSSPFNYFNDNNVNIINNISDLSACDNQPTCHTNLRDCPTSLHSPALLPDCPTSTERQRMTRRLRIRLRGADVFQ